VFDLETWEWIAIAVAVGIVLVAFAAAVWTSRRRRSSHLKDRFGPEYDRAVSASGQRDAEQRLADVEQKHDELEIRTLPSPTRDRYLDEWRQAEARFVSDPPDAVRAADRVVIRVLEERGYPVDGDVDERTAHVAADHPDVVVRYRHAHEMVHAADQSTENLRKAMVDLRIVLDQLLAPEKTAV
jgi:hypothetical protein